jgi:hypothetical protein
MAKLISAISESTPVQVILTILIYAFYGAALGLCLFPPFCLLQYGYSYLFPPGSTLMAANALFFCLVCGCSVFVFAFSGVIVLGTAIRFLSLGIKPGEYDIPSFTVLRWLIYSGVYTMALTLVLPLIPMSYFTNLFFSLVGCKMGKRVRLNSFKLNDAYMIELGDDVTIGGQADISPHIFQNGKLILRRVRIGSGSLIGAKAYIAPGVSIGQRCLIGLGSYIRQDSVIPDDAHYGSLGGLPMRSIIRIEKGRTPGAVGQPEKRQESAGG